MNGRESSVAGPFLVLAGAVLWGTTGTAQALGTSALALDVPPPVVGAARLVIGGTGLLLVATVTGALPSSALVRRRPVGVALLVGALAVGLYQPAFFGGVTRAGVAVGTVVAIGSAPAFTGLLVWLLRGERPERGWPLATLLAVLGSVLLLLPAGGVRVDPSGVLMALAAGLCFGAGTVGMKTMLNEGVAPVGVVALTFFGGAVLLLPVLAVTDLGWAVTPAGAAMALYLGLVATTVAYVLFGRGLRMVPASSAATLALAEPLTAALLGVLVLAERPGLLGWVGGGLVLAGLAVLSMTPVGLRR